MQGEIAMSNYNAGDMIRLTRQSLGISQEELSGNICSVQTLSRIENGKTSVKPGTYRQLMERMGRNGEKSYSVLSVEDFGLMEYKVKADTAIYRKEYEEAEACLKQLKPFMDLETNTVNIQYIRRKESIIQYRLKRITREEFLKRLEDIIALSIPDYERLLDKVYPFVNEEVQILMNIAIAYCELENYKKAVAINSMLIRSLEEGYMGHKDTVQLKVILMSNMAKYFGGLDEYQTAIDMSWDAINMAKEHGLITILPNAYAEIAWNMIQQIEKGERGSGELELCKKYLRQGYAAAAISNQNRTKQIIQNYYEESFGKKIY